MDRGKREDLLRFLLDEVIITPVHEKVRECRDPDDDKFLKLAVGAEADCIVSGDEGLLVPFRGIRTLTSREFLHWIAR